MTLEEIATLPPDMAALMFIMFALGIAAIPMMLEELIGTWLEERHYKKYGWSISTTGHWRVNPAWLIRQPNVQRQIQELKKLIDAGLIKAS